MAEPEVADHLGTTIMPSKIMTRWSPLSSGASPPPRAEEIENSPPVSTASNFHVEHIKFYVADFNTAYHTILGHPALAKFMAIPHYAYLVLKMTLSTGVLALWDNLSIAYAYETESLSLTEATDLSIQMASKVNDTRTVPADDLETPAL
ncbi:uncharacterized protein [Miscanthus floridulus]|uniref:uncharacterized protein n=1 Tax=Miscanthus floridulus TaxID=154761 RepID=UPI003459BCF9